ncbi:4'-phosphopantetheinyl transferase family protein [Aspergillus affinis]|uniref:4'-phosphopantetheinyl transferase family protein n=1 Tax=Aspergillus affinis TaxID=1070780 RepID=UPI0022FE0109|nr:4'-phosphopantetheinyl transferase [Aspergillus affinis]KAI9038044.1 4'-phosphopantetheinyl transferase [Aspergillus affinis]
MATAQHEANHPLIRWYIDTRPLTSTISTLPLLETLQPDDQETVKRFYHLRDRHMSLASYLLKYLFIHRACRIPWSKVKVSRTPAPHKRPCFIPDVDTTANTSKPIPAVEFNVSHQASLVALAGTTIPTITSTTPAPALAAITPSPSTQSHPGKNTPEVGIDITCVNERRNTRSQPPPTSIPEFISFVDIFSEVFSACEISTIKSLHGIPAHQNTTDAQRVAYGYRLFYTYWALKEAYIKMTGEALLAPWLRLLEFTDVRVLDPAAATGGEGECWNGPYTGVQTWLDGKKVEGVRIEVLAFQEDYLIATAARGAGVGAAGENGEERWLTMQDIEIERDVRDCALGRCRCLE